MFLLLPDTVRATIYRLCLHEVNGVLEVPYYKDEVILLTCRQTRREGLAIKYGEQTLAFALDLDLPRREISARLRAFKQLAIGERLSIVNDLNIQFFSTGERSMKNEIYIRAVIDFLHWEQVDMSKVWISLLERQESGRFVDYDGAGQRLVELEQHTRDLTTFERNRVLNVFFERWARQLDYQLAIRVRGQG